MTLHKLSCRPQDSASSGGEISSLWISAGKLHSLLLQWGGHLFVAVPLFPCVVQGTWLGCALLVSSLWQPALTAVCSAATKTGVTYVAMASFWRVVSACPPVSPVSLATRPMKLVLVSPSLLDLTSVDVSSHFSVQMMGLQMRLTPVMWNSRFLQGRNPWCYIRHDL